MTAARETNHRPTVHPRNAPGEPWPERTAFELERARPAWQDRALCKGQSPDLWFDPELANEAAEVCSVCPARIECLRWSLAQEAALVGVWGGLGQRARQRARRSGAVVDHLPQ